MVHSRQDERTGRSKVAYYLASLSVRLHVDIHVRFNRQYGQTDVSDVR